MLKEPVFLVGAERSGTTLMRLMLDSHPEIAFGEEFEYSVALIGDDGSMPSVADFEHMTGVDRIFLQSGFTIDSSREFPELVDGFLRSRRDAKGARIVGATIHFDYIRALHLWPDAVFIHMVRDPRDVARSSVQMGWSGNVWYGLDKWIEADEARKQLSKLVEPERIFDLRFEELMSDHLGVLKRICEFLGVEYTQDMLSYADSTDYDIPDPARAKDWRDDMSPLDIRLVESRLGDRLTAAGFQPSGLEPLPKNIVTESVLEPVLLAHSKLGRLRNRVSKLGLKLTVQEAFTRVSGNEEAHRKVLLEINEVSKAHLKRSWSEEESGRSSL